MNQTPAMAGRPRGRPRSRVCHQAILAATMALLEEKRYVDVTMEGIAARAGVAKQTLYKWWPSKARLTMEAYAGGVASRIQPPDTGSAEADLRDLLWQTCSALGRGNMGPTLAGLIAEAQLDTELQRELRETFIAARRQVSTAILERGMARGELRPDLDVSLVIDLVFGPVWYRLLLRHAPLDQAFANQVIDTLMPGLYTAPP